MFHGERARVMLDAAHRSPRDALTLRGSLIACTAAFFVMAPRCAGANTESDGSSAPISNNRLADANEPSSAVKPRAPSPELEAIDAIAAARCLREETCGHVGARNRFATLEACRVSVRTDWLRSLGDGDCRAGVDRRRLDACLTELRRRDCEALYDSIRRDLVCNPRELCGPR